jgi:hypothetical protein
VIFALIDSGWVVLQWLLGILVVIPIVYLLIPTSKEKQDRINNVDSGIEEELEAERQAIIIDIKQQQLELKKIKYDEKIERDMRESEIRKDKLDNMTLNQLVEKDAVKRVGGDFRFVQEELYFGEVGSVEHGGKFFHENWFIIIMTSLLFVLYVFVLFPDGGVRWGTSVDAETSREMFRYRYKVVILSGGEVAFYLKELLYVLFMVLGWVTLRRLYWAPYIFMVTVVAYLGYTWHLWNMSMTAKLLSNKCEGSYDYLIGNCLHGLGNGLDYGDIYGWIWLPFGVFMMVVIARITWLGYKDVVRNNDRKIDWLVIIGIITYFGVGVVL